MYILQRKRSRAKNSTHDNTFCAKCKYVQVYLLHRLHVLVHVCFKIIKKIIIECARIHMSACAQATPCNTIDSGDRRTNEGQNKRRGEGSKKLKHKIDSFYPLLSVYRSPHSCRPTCSPISLFGPLSSLSTILLHRAPFRWLYSFACVFVDSIR